MQSRRELYKTTKDYFGVILLLIRHISPNVFLRLVRFIILLFVEERNAPGEFNFLIL